MSLLLLLWTVVLKLLALREVKSLDVTQGFDVFDTCNTEAVVRIVERS